ncbi:MAG TPA: septum formation initiator family protein [Patescibacteria group bacterium]|nr:septum formation initiator family protein [Patescibacteria group bacterium]
MITLFKKGFFIFLSVFLIYSLVKNILDFAKKTAFYRAYDQEFEEEREKNKKLKSELMKSQDYYMVEKNIREKLQLLKEDEVDILIARPSPTPTIIPIPPSSPIKQWYELFVSKK